MTKIILATSSPYRHEAFKQLNIPFSVEASNINEQFENRPTNPEELCLLLAKLKAEEVARNKSEGITIGFDTIAYHNNQILEKPKSREEAFNRLINISDDQVQYFTGIHIINFENKQILSKVNKSILNIRKISENEIEKIGIIRSFDIIKNSHKVLFIFDGPESFLEYKKLSQIVDESRIIKVLNKIDVSLKKEPVDLMSSVPEDYLKIKTSGVIDFDKQIYLYSLNEKGAPGFNVVNPIIINNKNFLLNRGWIPFDKKNTKEIDIFDHRIILGTLKKQTKGSKFKPVNDIKDNYWFTLDRNDVFKYTNKNFSPFIIYLNNNLELPKPKIITVNISNSHKKYAITWFSLAFSIFFFYLYVRKNKY